MGSLAESYERQFSALSAEITAEICKLKSSEPARRKELTSAVEGRFEEADDLLEQLELEIGGSNRSGLASRLACYRAELARIRAEFDSSKPGDVHSYGDNDEHYEEWNPSKEQRQKLLDNSDKIEKSGKKLNEGYRILLETEQVGNAVLGDLSVQRETIQRARNRLRETDEHLDRSARIMNGMIARTLRQKFVLIAFLLFFAAVVSLAVYFSLN